VARLIAGDGELRGEYEAIFGPLPGGLEGDALDRVFANYGKALAAYQRRLVSRRAPFDVFVEGLREDDAEKRAALTPAQVRGLALFVGKGRCRMCHAGPNFSDGEFHGTGVAPLGGGDPFDPARYEGVRAVLNDPFNALGPHSDARAGAAAEKLETLARGPETWGEFKTPTLRNVARTAPYMHQGQFASLADVVRFYSTLEGSAPPGHHQEQVLQPLELTEDEQADLIAFLESLTDENLDPSLLAPP
jgi:cytochrome c peroxidase